MRLRRSTSYLVEPPSSATGDIAFNLIVFFLVCASSEPDTGRRQNLPRSEAQSQKTPQEQNLEVALERSTVTINGERVKMADFVSQVRRKLQGKKKPEERLVVVKSRQDVPYHHWIAVTGSIEQAGGTVVLQVEEEQRVQVP